MTPEELARWIADTPHKVLPLVGAGLAIPAGALSAPGLAAALARSLEVKLTGPADLDDLTQRASKEHGEAVVQEHLAEIVTGWRLRPTPALTALSGARRVLTTN